MPSATAPSRSGSSSPPASAETAAVDGGFGLYVHWPFCLSKCPYCDFNSHVRERVDEARWRRALLGELERAADAAPGRRLDSIFFGGGTPSLMPPDLAGAVIARARDVWRAADAIEITLEANPGAAEAARFAAFRDAGINRVSIGVQALDDAALAFLGRKHKAAEAIAAVARARTLFGRVSFDLIYARPGQTVLAWRRELAAALALADEHVSLYQLTIEPGTAFHTAHARGDFALPDEALAADLFEETQAALAAAGMPAYEISNHARPGAESRHNLVYWRYGDYAGIGPGAHGRLTSAAGGKVATRQHRLPEAWLAAVEGGHGGEAERAPLDAETRGREMLLMGLRLAEGVSLARFRRETGRALSDFVDAPALARLEDGGLVARRDGRLAATPAGRQRLDAVLKALLP
jgi:putative oxygen-independent coproporphyrinogen III oxidase